MDIRELDASALADDELMGRCYDLSRRAELLGREEAPFWSLEEFIATVRSTDVGERQQIFVAVDGERVVSVALLWSFLLDNLDKCWFSLDVDVPDRRRGVGRAMLERIESVAKADHRSLLLTDSKMPFDESETHGHRRFAEACGFELSQFEVMRHLPLPVPDETIQAWLDEAAPRQEGYTIQTFVDEVPDDLLESLCVLLGQLAVDAPTGAVEFEEEVMTPDRYREGVETVRKMGRSRYETVAFTPDRLVAAHSTLAVPVTDSTTVYQWGTFVHREHRGHALGLATKAVNLRAAQASRDDLTLVTTQNAETNGYMVSINERMGFEPVEVVAEFLKRI